MPEKNEQLIDLQTKFSFQEDHLQELNQVVTRQAQQIDSLQRQLKALHERLLEVIDGQQHLSAAETEEKPPHY